MRVSSRFLIAFGSLVFVGVGAGAFGQSSGRDAPRRLVLVELYTSQGCDMCPAAEAVLGCLAARDPLVVPVAFHVDYFNDPWRDVFSDPLYSRRQREYDRLYSKPKDRQYGLYYTPMMMIDGRQAVNGRDRASAVAAIREARSRAPAVAIDVDLALEPDGSSGTAVIRVSSRTPRVEKRPLLVCAVLREDGVITEIPAGENAGRSLVARYPARRTEFGFVELADGSPVIQRFTFAIEPGWDRRNLRLAVFVQDRRTGLVHQATDLPWRSTARASATTDPPARAR